jgi:hypothetical protein
MCLEAWWSTVRLPIYLRSKPPIEVEPIQLSSLRNGNEQYRTGKFRMITSKNSQSLSSLRN